MEMPNGKQIVITIEPRLLDRRGMALCLSISEDTLDALRKRGLPSVTIPGISKPLFHPDSVVEWMLEQSKPPETLSEKEASEELDSLLRNRGSRDRLWMA